MAGSIVEPGGGAGLELDAPLPPGGGGQAREQDGDGSGEEAKGVFHKMNRSASREPCRILLI